MAAPKPTNPNRPNGRLYTVIYAGDCRGCERVVTHELPSLTRQSHGQMIHVRCYQCDTIIPCTKNKNNSKDVTAVAAKPPDSAKDKTYDAPRR